MYPSNSRFVLMSPLHQKHNQCTVCRYSISLEIKKTYSSLHGANTYKVQYMYSYQGHLSAVRPLMGVAGAKGVNRG